MSQQIHSITITVTDREAAFNSVNRILHDHAAHILLRVGYPMRERNLAIIFLITEMTTDELGALTGRLGQTPSVRVQSTTIKPRKKP